MSKQAVLKLKQVAETLLAKPQEKGEGERALRAVKMRSGFGGQL